MASKHGSKKKRDKKYVQRYDGSQLSVMFSAKASMETELTPHTTLATIKAGQADKFDLNRLIYMCEIAAYMATHFTESSDINKQLIAAVDACTAIKVRGKEKQRFVGTGDELATIASAIQLFEQLKATVTRQQFAVALAKAYRD